MESTLVALVTTAVLTVGAVFLSGASYSAIDRLGQSWKTMEQTVGEQARTYLTVTSTAVDAPGTVVLITLKNAGQARIGDFSRMDVIVQYYDALGAYHIVWLPYTAGEPGNNQWTVSSVLPDQFEPGIVNPGEEITIKIRLSPSVGLNTSNWLTVVTPNGISLSTYFVR